MNTFSLRKISLIFLLAFFSFFLTPVVFAQNKGVAVEIPVAANGYPDKQDELIAGAYINMYSVVPVRAGVYEGNLLETSVVSSNGSGAIFKVEPGKIVEFVAFRDAVKAKNTKYWTFTSPPYKNFTAQDGVGGRLCQINFLDKENKMTLSDGSASCGISMSYPLSDKYVVVSASDLNKPLGNFEVWVQKTNEPTTIVKNAMVRLYDAGTNEIISKTSNGERGIVTFILELERKFYYDGFADGVMYGGYKTPYVDTPRVFYLTGDGKGIKNSFDNSFTYVRRLGAYPNTQATEPTSVSVLEKPAAKIVLDSPRILQPKENEVLTNYPRIAKIEWAEVSGSLNYEVIVECDLCGSTRWGTKQELPLVSITNTLTPALWGDNQFRVKVRAVARDGTRGQWSDYRYFSYKTTSTQSVPLKAGTIDLEYRYFSKGAGNSPEKGRFSLTLSSDYLHSGYNFKDQKYTSVGGGAFYVTDNDKDRIARFYGNNIGQGGLYDFGEVNIDQVTPPIERSKYNRFGLIVYPKHTYAVYDAANETFALINVVSISSEIISTPLTAPITTPKPTVPVLDEYDYIDDFIEEGDEVDIEFKDANVQFGRRTSLDKKTGFRFGMVLDNHSEDIQRALIDIRCDALTNGDRISLVRYSKQYDLRPENKQYRFFQSFSEEQERLIHSLQSSGGKINCNFAIVGIIDFDTGLTVPDSDVSNNRIEIQLQWKKNRLRMNTSNRVGL